MNNYYTNHHVCKWTICTSGEWKSTASASCNWWQPPPVQVERLHKLKEAKHHKHKVHRSGCKVQRSGHKVQRSRPVSALVGTGCSNNMQLQPPPPPTMQTWPTQHDAAISATCMRAHHSPYKPRGELQLALYLSSCRLCLMSHIYYNYIIIHPNYLICPES